MQCQIHKRGICLCLTVCLTLSLNVQTGKITAENRIHDADIKDMQLSKDGTHFITASGDRTSKLVDSQDLQVMKEFAFERPANAAAMSPIADHVSHTPHAASLPPCPAEVRPAHLYILLH